MIEPARANTPLAPIEVQSFANEADRQRLTAAGLNAFKRLARAWDLTNQEASSLLGVSGSTWDRMKRNEWEGQLSQDQLTRVSALLGIYKGLKLIFVDAMAERWPRLRNKGPLFNRATPIESMIEGGIPHLIEVRRYIDAVRGGL